MDASPHAASRLRFGADAEPLPESPAVLVLVDFINPLQFGDAGRLAPCGVAAARAAAALKQRLSGSGVQAIYANDNYGIWRSEFRDVVEYCHEVGGAAHEMADLLAPTGDDFTVLKPRHSAFFATPLELLLQQMQARELILAGLATDICVQLTAMDAYLRGFKIRAPEDCSAAESEHRHQAALEHMRLVLKVDTTPSEQLRLDQAAGR